MAWEYPFSSIFQYVALLRKNDSHKFEVSNRKPVFKYGDSEYDAGSIVQRSAPQLQTTVFQQRSAMQ